MDKGTDAKIIGAHWTVSRYCTILSLEKKSRKGDIHLADLESMLDVKTHKTRPSLFMQKNNNLATTTVEHTNENRLYKVKKPLPYSKSNMVITFMR